MATNKYDQKQIRRTSCSSDQWRK